MVPPLSYRQLMRWLVMVGTMETFSSSSFMGEAKVIWKPLRCCFASVLPSAGFVARTAGRLAVRKVQVWSAAVVALRAALAAPAARRAMKLVS